VDWAIVNRVIRDYQETKDAEANSVLAAEEPTHSMSDDKIKERRQLRVKHRALLMTCQELDATMEIAEDPATTSWSSSSTRPVSSVEAAEVVLPPIARNYLHPSILQDIRVTGERAFSTNKQTTKKTPLRLDVLPKDERCFTTSWLPADDKLFPQAHLSDESVIRLHRDLAKQEYTKPATVSVAETVLQEFAARGRTSIQASSLLQQLLRVLRTLATNQRKKAHKDSNNMKSSVLSCDVIDRAADILNQVTRQSLQTVHTQTLLLRSSYLKTFSKKEIKPEELLDLRAASLFSSQVLPTQACHVALKNSRSTASLEAAHMMTLQMSGTLKEKATSKPQSGYTDNGATGGGGRGGKKRRRGNSKGRQDEKRPRDASQTRGPPPRNPKWANQGGGRGNRQGGYQKGGGNKGTKSPYRPKQGS
jgi:hypothetical protein